MMRRLLSLLATAACAVLLCAAPSSAQSPLRNAIGAFPFSDVEGADAALTFSVLTQDPSLPHTIGMAPSAFTGTALPLSPNADFTLDVSVMLPHIADAEDGCTAWRTKNEYNQTFAGKFVLLLKSTKCDATSLTAVAAGAAGIILQGCSPSAPTYCAERLQSDYTFVMISVPVIVVTYAHGQQLREYLQAQRALYDPALGQALPSDALQVQFISTGPIVPAERAALVSIMNSTTMSFFQAYTPEPIPFWSKARFLDPNLDPCRDRVKGIWCERGRVVMAAVNFHAWETPSGPPAEFSAFTAMKFINIETNRWVGAIPDSWCAMTDLRVFQLGNQNFGSGTGITSLPNCVWPKLNAYHFYGNALTALPANFVSSTELVHIYGGNNKLTSFPSLAGFTRLELLDLASNAATGAIPALPSSAPLQALSFANNKFTQVAVGAFNGMSSLVTLDLNSNRISGSLPALVGCSSLVTLDLSSQRDLSSNSSVGFTTMPASWKALTSVVKLSLQENSLVAPVFISDMLRTAWVDVSDNMLTRAVESDPANIDFDKWAQSVLSSSVTMARFSNNPGLKGDTGIFPSILSHTNLAELYLDGCGLTTLFDSIFAVGLVTLDVSNNNITQDHISASGNANSPAASFRNLFIQGNPNFRVAELPAWLVPKDTRVQQPGAHFACAPLTVTSAPLMSIVTDAEFFNHRYCDCTLGMFGKAPLCEAIPNAASLNPHRLISSDQLGAEFATLIEQAGGLASQLQYTEANSTAVTYSQAFSDAMYGTSARLMQGLSTSFTVDLSDQYADDADAYATLNENAPAPIQTYTVASGASAPALTTPVREITLHLHVSAADFNSFDDKLEIYEGGADLKGTRVFTLRGTDGLPLTRSSAATSTAAYLAMHNASISQLGDARLIEVQVFSAKATMQFDNRRPGGQYFYATYSYAFVCPAGYFYDRSSRVAPLVAQCRPNYPTYAVGDSIRNAVFAVSALAAAFVAFNIAVLLWKWESMVYKAASRAFMLLILLLLEGLALGASLYAAVPTVASGSMSSSNAVCISRAWLTCLPLAGVLAVLLAKTARLNSIFNSKILTGSQSFGDMKIIIIVSVVCAVQVLILAVFSGMPLSKPQLALGFGGFSERLVTGCSQESGFMTWFGIEVAFISALILPAVYLGFKTRDLPSQYNESSHIQNAVVLLAFFGVIILPLDIFIQDDPTAAILIQGLGQAFLCLLLTIILFAPKLYFCLGRGGQVTVAGKDQTHLGTAVDTSNTPTRAGAHDKPHKELSSGGAPATTRRASLDVGADPSQKVRSRQDSLSFPLTKAPANPRASTLARAGAGLPKLQMASTLTSSRSHTPLPAESPPNSAIPAVQLATLTPPAGARSLAVLPPVRASNASVSVSPPALLSPLSPLSPASAGGSESQVVAQRRRRIIVHHVGAPVQMEAVEIEIPPVATPAGPA